MMWTLPYNLTIHANMLLEEDGTFMNEVSIAFVGYFRQTYYGGYNMFKIVHSSELLTFFSSICDGLIIMTEEVSQKMNF